MQYFCTADLYEDNSGCGCVITFTHKDPYQVFLPKNFSLNLDLVFKWLTCLNAKVIRFSVKCVIGVKRLGNTVFLSFLEESQDISFYVLLSILYLRSNIACKL